MSSSRKTLLCIDDHEASVAGWCLYLQYAGYAVETASSAQEGLQLFATQAVDLVLLDYAMPEVNGAEVAAIMKRIKPDVRIVILSGFPQTEQNGNGVVDAWISKGQNPRVVLQTIEELLYRERAA